ncbi:MFS transporter [Psychromarinibacter sp. C21-152]|uniref:MFS transporter n=1 Tax=Psychromarinibacter sediminicola TaxID=3033385 RepID=A0AAE3NN82_9RHOB|nr:MFS transporter [Psychromarinibacter sediminicola]MDF0600433.1 MFS transporter [Psychromarinibacter sediminicola]
MRQFLPISALLLGSAFLLFAGGINALILPVRGTAEGFSSLALGLLGTGWALGYVTGCLFTPRLVARVGHIRSFGVMCALAAIAILASLLILTPWAWVPLRAISGVCFAGAAMIVESWLSERAAPKDRGKVFGIYTMVNLVASTAGQLVLTLGDTRGFLFFVLGAIFYSLALVPTAVSSSASPNPLVNVRLDLRGLWRNSPVAVFGVFLVGISNSAFGTLGAVYAERVGLALSSMALFASLPILAGALAQVPVGALSDRTDRRWVLVGLAALAAATDAAFILLAPTSLWANLALAAAFGAAVFSMYPVILAHANDHAAEGAAIQTSGGLLMIFGVGGIAGPLIAGLGMTRIGAAGLFWTSVAAHVLLILFVIWRISVRAGLTEAQKGHFTATPMGRTTTPETAMLAATEEEMQDELEDAAEAEKGP